MIFKITVLAALCFIILYITNPTKKEFIDFYSQKISKAQQDESLSNIILLEGKKIYTQINVEREDKYIFSLYTVEFLGEEETYIGIFKNFFEKNQKKV